MYSKKGCAQSEWDCRTSCAKEPDNIGQFSNLNTTKCSNIGQSKNMTSVTLMSKGSEGSNWKSWTGSQFWIPSWAKDRGKAAVMPRFPLEDVAVWAKNWNKRALIVFRGGDEEPPGVTEDLRKQRTPEDDERMQKDSRERRMVESSV